MPEKYVLRQYQALPLEAKVRMSYQRIREWYDHWDGDVYVSFSGGKDSTVLAHLVHEWYPNVPLVFANTGLEYPEIRQFAEKMGAEIAYPEKRFDEVISTYGYPIISKENAEAIFVARRIRNGSVDIYERKGRKKHWIDGKREELNGQRSSEDGVHVPEEEPEEKPKETLEEHRARVQESYEKRTKSGEWVNWRRQAIAGTGAFSQEKKSIFNKQKWLPLARDTQFMISHKCCDVMKKGPMNKYQRRTKRYPILGTLADESRLRERAWVKNGCNAFEATVKTSQPMSFWMEQDVLNYIYKNGYEIAPVYGDIVAVDKHGNESEPLPLVDCQLKCTGCDRTGCIYCAFGAHLKGGEERFTRLAKTHPKQYEYCMEGGQWVDNPNYDPAAPKMDGELVNWNPKKIWVPSKKGLGMRHVFEEVNALYGKDFIKFE